MKKKISLILLLFTLTISSFAEIKEVLYPNLNGLGENALGFQLLKLALGKVDESYDVKLSEKEMNSTRASQLVEDGLISVADGGVTQDQDARFDIVYIPIDMGLLGWRIFIINKNLQDDFHKIKTLDDLKTKKAGQGQGWPDGLIIENAGIKVIRAAKIEFLINMVDGKRFDFFPLGANETHGFLNTFGSHKPNLVVEDSLTMVYPFGRFFFLKKGNKELHDAITLGLERAFEDGTFKELILNHPFFKEGLEKSDLKNRTVIRIDNPFLPEKFNDIDPKWWYNVD